MKIFSIYIIIVFTVLATISCLPDADLQKNSSDSVIFNTSTIVLNPSGYTPLSAGLLLTAKENLIAVIRIESAFEGQEDLVAELNIPISDDEQWLPVLGLYPDYENIVHLLIKSAEGETLLDTVQSIKTKAVYEELPSRAEVEGGYTDASKMIFASYSLRGLFNLQQGIVFDQYGNVRWYSQFPYGYHPLEITDGMIIAGDHGYKNKIHRINMLGFTEESKTFGTEDTGFNYIHHDIADMGNNHYLLTVNDTDLKRRENILIEYDFDNSQVVKSWDLENILPNVDDLYADLPNTYYRNNEGEILQDILHINAVDFDRETRNILVTSQRFGAALISYEGELLWILAPHNLKKKNIEPDYNPLIASSRKDNENVPTWPPVNDGKIVPGAPAYSFLAEFDSDDPDTWRTPAYGRFPDYVKKGESWNYDNFLLDPVVMDGKIELPERLVDSGQDVVINGETLFAWPFRPHTARFLENGDIVIFDNGFSRNFNPFVNEDSFSRAVAYRVDRNENGYGGNVSQVWEYKLSEGWDGFSLFLGETEELENGNILIDFGGLGKADKVLKYFNPLIDPSILISDYETYKETVKEDVVIVEIDPDSAQGPEEIFKIRFPSNQNGTTGSYRASKFNLYDAWLLR